MHPGEQGGQMLVVQPPHPCPAAETGPPRAETGAAAARPLAVGRALAAGRALASPARALLLPGPLMLPRRCCRCPGAAAAAPVLLLLPPRRCCRCRAGFQRGQKQ
jgi:hypothetical protein